MEIWKQLIETELKWEAQSKSQRALLHAAICSNDLSNSKICQQFLDAWWDARQEHCDQHSDMLSVFARGNVKIGWVKGAAWHENCLRRTFETACNLFAKRTPVLPFATQPGIGWGCRSLPKAAFMKEDIETKLKGPFGLPSIGHSFVKNFAMCWTAEDCCKLGKPVGLSERRPGPKFLSRCHGRNRHP